MRSLLRICLLALGMTSGIALGRPLVIAHYMPWFATPQFSGSYGYHWTVNQFDPGKIQNGKYEIGSHYRPLIGPYDSGDPDLLECHVALMKLSGIEGVFVDWYGTRDHFDYLSLHKNTLKLIPVLKRAGLKFGIVYEDQTVPHLIKGGLFRAEEARTAGRSEILWMQTNWFRDPNYIQVQGKPALLVFGPQFYKPDDWQAILQGLNVNFFTLHIRREPAIGAFDWPLPENGTNQAFVDSKHIVEKSRNDQAFISSAFPRFWDWNLDQKAKRRIDDRDGKTYRDTFRTALNSKADIVQIATWNDWGEATVIEPSVEFGYRDLEFTQKLVSKFAPADLRLPIRLYQLRKAGLDHQVQLKNASDLLLDGKPELARKILDRVAQERLQSRK